MELCNKVAAADSTIRTSSTLLEASLPKETVAFAMVLPADAALHHSLWILSLRKSASLTRLDLSAHAATVPST